MGMIRKTLSVGTLGTVSFRSKKEKLRRAERSRHQAEELLQSEHDARKNAEHRIAAAERRVKAASAAAAVAGWQLDRSKKKRRAKRAKRDKLASETIGELRSGVEPLVRSGVESARSGVESARRASADVTTRGRKAGRKARKQAKKSLGRARATATASASAAKEAALDAAREVASGRLIQDA